jgi:RNA polymerase sigma-70 factor (ECF subfamily)
MGAGPSGPPDALVPAPDDLLSEALARLPEKHRLPLLLFYFDGRDTGGVAEALDITISAAATRLCRARRALRAILEVRHD